jgi:hypothetical protein
LAARNGAKRYSSKYKLAWRKHKKVFEEITNANWTRGLWRMNTITEMAKFVDLWG